MTSNEFNNKWKKYLREGHYGLSIDIPEVINFLDKEFQRSCVREDFSYSQIKLKFGAARVYAEGCDALSIEDEINRIIKNIEKNDTVQWKRMGT